MKIIKLIVPLLLICICFSSCNIEGSLSSIADISEKSEGLSSLVLKDNEQQNPNEEKLENYYNEQRTLDCGLIIDAPVRVKQVNQTLPKVNTKIIQPSPDTIFETFMYGKEIVYQEEYLAENTYSDITTAQVYRASDETVLSIQPTAIYYDTYLYTALYNTFRENKNDVTYNAEQFLTGENLSFITIQEAEAKIKQVLNNFGIDMPNTTAVFTLNQVNIEGAQTEIDNYNKNAFSNEIEAEWFYSHIDWDSTLDCYIFLFSPEIENVFVTSYSQGFLEDGSLTQGSNIKVIYSQRGIEYLEITNLYQVVDKATPEKILALEQAISLLDQKYNSLILYGDYVVYDISLEYIPTRIKNDTKQFVMIPAWSFEIRHTSEYQKGSSTVSLTERYRTVFNAINGEEIISEFKL